MRPDLPASGTEESDDVDRRRIRRPEYDVSRRYNQDREHLRVLSICFYVYGGLLALGGLFPLIYVFLGVVFLSGSLPAGPGAPPAFMGWFFIVFGGGLSLLAWTLAGCSLFTGYSLSQLKRYIFCFVVACLCCLQMGPIPLGTILGVFTIVVLARPGMKELFTGVHTGPHPAADE